MAKIDMKHIVSELQDVAKLYQTYFLGKCFAFIDEDQGFEEVICTKGDFAHLTGVYTNLKDKDLYDKCINKTLQPTEIHFNERFDYKSYKKKMKSLHKVYTLIDGTSNNTRGLYNVIRKKGKFPYAIADFDTTLCFNYKGNMLHPKSIRHEIIRDYSANKRIVLIAEKQDIDALYHKINFGRSKLLEEVSESVKSKFDIEIYKDRV